MDISTTAGVTWELDKTMMSLTMPYRRLVHSSDGHGEPACPLMTMPDTDDAVHEQSLRSRHGGNPAVASRYRHLKPPQGLH
jgi:hypothetical protein